MVHICHRPHSRDCKGKKMFSGSFEVLKITSRWLVTVGSIFLKILIQTITRQLANDQKVFYT